MPFMEDKKKKESSLKTIMRTVAGTIITAFIIYHFMPSFVETSFTVGADEYCEILEESQLYPMFFNRDPEIEVYFDNNNDGFVRINNITVKTVDYVYLSESDIAPVAVGGLGDPEEPIYLKAEVSSRINGEYDCEFNTDLAYYAPGTYIEIGSKSGDKFHITLDPLLGGKYEIQFEIEYTYNGRKITETTDTCTFVFLEQYASQGEM